MLSRLHRLVFGTPSYEAVQLTSSEPLLNPAADTGGVLLRVQPYADDRGIAAAAGVYRALHDVETSFWGSNTSPAYAFETWFAGGELTFTVYAATEAAADSFRRHLTTNYPNADIERLTEGAGFPRIQPGEYVAGARVATTLGSYYPIRHHTNDGFDTDPYGALTQELFADDAATRVVAQVVFRPAKHAWTSGSRLRTDSIDDIAHGLRQGTSVGWLNPTTRPPSKADKRAATVLEQERDKPAYHATIRILGVSPSKRAAEARTQGVARMFENHYNGVADQGLEATPVWHRDDDGTVARLREFVGDMAARKWAPQQTILTVDELAGVAHLPPAEVGTSAIDWQATQQGDHVASSDSQFNFDAADRESVAPDGGDTHV